MKNIHLTLFINLCLRLILSLKLAPFHICETWLTWFWTVFITSKISKSCQWRLACYNIVNELHCTTMPYCKYSCSIFWICCKIKLISNTCTSLLDILYSSCHQRHCSENMWNVKFNFRFVMQAYVSSFNFYW